MSLSRRLRATVLAAAFPVVLGASLLGQAALAGPASAITAPKIQLKGGQLLVEGAATVQGAGIIMVESTTSGASAYSGAGGKYKVQATGFTAPDCKLTIRDYLQTITASIPQCTPSIPPVPAKPAAPTGTCVITPSSTPTTLKAGTMGVIWVYATGCDTSSPLTLTQVAGAIPTGMTMGTYQNSTSGNIIGTPSVPGTYRFTVQVRDSAGATDQETFTANVV